MSKNKINNSIPKLSTGNHTLGNTKSGNIKDELIAPRPKYKEETFKSLLQQHNLKVTNQRLSILKALNSGSKTHLTAREIFERVSKNYPNIGFSTVYRFLKLITQLNITSELKLSNSSSRYELKSDTHHHHITCVHCGRIVEFENEKIEKTIREVSQHHQFSLKHHIIELYGSCGKGHCVRIKKNTIRK